MKKLKLFTLALLILLSFNLSSSWASEDMADTEFAFSEQMTLQELADLNQIPISKLLSKLDLPEGNANKTISSIAENTPSLTIDQIESDSKKVFLETQIEQGKDWKLIAAKFFLWVALIITLAIAMAKSKKIPFKPLLLFLSAIVFGVILGSDPNPLGTVKDGLVLYANEGILFKPRFVALAFLLLLALIFSRIFCGWACQIGVVQDFLYRLPGKKIKLPFWLTNSVRVIVFAAMFLFAFGFHIDLLGYVDPFKLYTLNPAAFNVGFILLIVALSFIIYRPWCTLACPFGFLAWIVNKFSFLKLRLKPELCSNCNSCNAVCPTGAVKRLREDSCHAECYMCDRCRETCPNSAITYGKKIK